MTRRSESRSAGQHSAGHGASGQGASGQGASGQDSSSRDSSSRGTAGSGLVDPMPPGDAELITSSRTSDPAAYAVLYQRHVVAARA
ncbi:MAG TPA: hypothetical protein VGG16_08850, partial [Streptosporangiaceae bacterium]